MPNDADLRRGAPGRQDVDPDVRAWLEAPDDIAPAILQRIVTDRILPVVRTVVARRVRDLRDRQESDDWCGEVMVPLLTRLQRIRNDPAADTIADVSRYAAVMAERVCDAHLRRKFPGRSRLKNRIRYVMTRGTACVMEAAPGGEWLCGLASWPRPWPARQTGRAQQFRLMSSVDASRALGLADPHSEPLAGVLLALLGWLGGPVELDDLVSAAGTLLGTTDAPAMPDEGRDGPHEAWWERLADPSKAIPAAFDDREYLRQVWEEIRALPVRQRAAVLLNLRDDGGGDVTSLLPVLGIASIGQIAAVLEWPPEALAEIWSRLPLDDLTIAGRLGLTRQQVINLRKSARQRLARRLIRQETGGGS